MKKCLKLADPFTKTFPNLTHILAIIQDIPSAKLWYINNFIQIQVNEDASYPNLNVSFRISMNWSIFIRKFFI